MLEKRAEFDLRSSGESWFGKKQRVVAVCVQVGGVLPLPGKKRFALGIMYVFALAACVLIESGCAGMLPLERAAYDGDTATVKQLLEDGANPNEMVYGVPLFWATKKCNVEIARGLLEHGANVDWLSHDNFTPLGAAAVEGCEEVLRILIQNGANVNYVCSNPSVAKTAEICSMNL